MSNVLIEIENLNATTELAIKSFKKIFSYCDAVLQFRQLKTITENDLNWSDCYIAIRPYTPESVQIAKKIRNSNRLYIVSYDDDLLNLRDGAPWRNRCCLKCLKLANVVLGSNPYLIKNYAGLTESGRYFIINTPVDKSEIKKPHTYDSITRFVYAAGKDHADNFEKILAPAIGKLLETEFKHVHITFIGVEPDISFIGHKECFSFVPMMPLEEYNSYMAEHIFDVGLAPLPDDSFSHSKYFNKYIEYSKVGILGIYSNSLPLTLIVKNHSNGLLVDNGTQNWLETMEYVIHNHDELISMIDSAQSILIKDFNVQNIASAFTKEIPEIMTLKATDTIKYHANYFENTVFWISDNAYKFISRSIKIGPVKTIKNLLKNSEYKRKLNRN
jgi:hypothetical protein